MTILSKQYPMDLTTGSTEQVNQSAPKIDMELGAIYGHLNNIRTRYRSATAPTNPESGQVWEDTVNNKIMKWNGSAWVKDIGVSINLTNRNTVLQGTVDGSGNPTLIAGDASDLTADLVATTETIIAIPAGHDATVGNFDYVISFSATQTDFWTSLPANNTSYLFVDYSSGTVTGTYSVIAPVYQAFAPAHSSGKNWYDTNKEQWYVSDGSNWVAKYRCCVGSVVTDGTKVIATTIKAYNAFNSVQQAIIDAKVSQTITDGVTDKAPSEDAVAEAIKLLATLNNPKFTGLVGINASNPLFGLHVLNDTAGYAAAFKPYYAGYGVKVGANTTNGCGAIQGVNVSYMNDKLAINPGGQNVAIGHGNAQATVHGTGSTILGGAGTSSWDNIGNGEFCIWSDQVNFYISYKNNSGGHHLLQFTLPAAGGERTI